MGYTPSSLALAPYTFENLLAQRICRQNLY